EGWRCWWRWCCCWCCCQDAPKSVAFVGGLRYFTISAVFTARRSWCVPSARCGDLAAKSPALQKALLYQERQALCLPLCLLCTLLLVLRIALAAVVLALAVGLVAGLIAVALAVAAIALAVH